MQALNGKLLNSFSDGHTNVSTNRRITRLDNPAYDYYTVKKFNICGTPDHLAEFAKLNKIELKKHVSTPVKKNVARSPMSPKKGEPTKTHRNIPLLPIPGVQEERAMSPPRRIVSPPREQPVLRKLPMSPPKTCIKKVMRALPPSFEDNDHVKFSSECKGKVPYKERNTDVEKVSFDMENRIGQFSFNGAKGKARVTQLLNTNTIELLFYADLEQLSRNVLCADMGVGFFTKLKCCWNGIRFPPIDTINGQIAYTLMDEFFDYLDNIVYIKLLSFSCERGKEGREGNGGIIAVEMYSDPSMQNNIGDKFIGIMIPELEEKYIALPLFHKNIFSGLQRVSPNYIKETEGYRKILNDYALYER